jgi:hypothetical protein
MIDDTFDSELHGEESKRPSEEREELRAKGATLVPPPKKRGWPFASS